VLSPAGVVRIGQLRQVIGRKLGSSDLIVWTFLLRRSLLLSRGTGLILIGSRFDACTRRLLQVRLEAAPVP
jgi:hypothetical protein